MDALLTNGKNKKNLLSLHEIKRGDLNILNAK